VCLISHFILFFTFYLVGFACQYPNRHTCNSHLHGIKKFNWAEGMNHLFTHNKSFHLIFLSSTLNDTKTSKSIFCWFMARKCFSFAYSFGSVCIFSRGGKWTLKIQIWASTGYQWNPQPNPKMQREFSNFLLLNSFYDMKLIFHEIISNDQRGLCIGNIKKKLNGVFNAIALYSSSPWL